MTQAEAVLLAYLIIWTIAGHWFVLRWWELRRKHKRRSKAALKAAATRKRNGSNRSPRPPRTATEKKPKAKKPIEDRVIPASAWFEVEEEEPDYNEVEMGEAWRPKVRRFNGTASEYAARDPEGDSVG